MGLSLVSPTGKEPAKACSGRNVIYAARGFGVCQEDDIIMIKRAVKGKGDRVGSGNGGDFGYDRVRGYGAGQHKVFGCRTVYCNVFGQHDVNC